MTYAEEKTVMVMDPFIKKYIRVTGESLDHRPNKRKTLEASDPQSRRTRAASMYFQNNLVPKLARGVKEGNDIIL